MCHSTYISSYCTACLQVLTVHKLEQLRLQLAEEVEEPYRKVGEILCHKITEHGWQNSSIANHFAAVCIFVNVTDSYIWSCPLDLS